MNLPKIGDTVEVIITSKDELGYIVNLIDSGLEGFVLLSGGARNKRYNVGETYTATVIRMEHAVTGTSWNGDKTVFIDLEFDKISKQKTGKLI